MKKSTQQDQKSFFFPLAHKTHTRLDEYYDFKTTRKPMTTTSDFYMVVGSPPESCGSKSYI